MNNKETQKILQKVAKANGQSIIAVKAEIEKAILSAYVFPNKEALSIPRTGEIPTVDEFLEYVINELGKIN